MEPHDDPWTETVREPITDEKEREEYSQETKIDDGAKARATGDDDKVIVECVKESPKLDVDRPTCSKNVASKRHYPETTDAASSGTIVSKKSCATPSAVVVVSSQLPPYHMPTHEKLRCVEDSSEYVVTSTSMVQNVLIQLHEVMQQCDKGAHELLKSLEIALLPSGSEPGSNGVLFVFSCWYPTPVSLLVANLGLFNYLDELRWETVDENNEKQAQLLQALRNRELRSSVNYKVSLPSNPRARWEAIMRGIKEHRWSMDICRMICPRDTQRDEEHIRQLVRNAPPPPLGYERKTVRVFALIAPKDAGHVFVKARHGESQVYKQTVATPQFDGYDPRKHRVIVVDDVCKLGKARFEPYFLKLLISHGMLWLRMNVGECYCTASIIYFLSEHEPDTWFDDVVEAEQYKNSLHWIGRASATGERFNWTKGPQLRREEEQFEFVEGEPLQLTVIPQRYPPKL